MLIKTKLTDPVFSIKFKLMRLSWNIFYWIFIKFSPTFMFAYRAALLRLWGADVAKSVLVYSSSEIWWPANLVLADNSTLGPRTTIYNQGKISIGKNVIVSQGAHLCASTHDYNNPIHPLILAPISVMDDVWICAEAFVGPGVVLEMGCVVGARAVVAKSTESLGIYGGNPAKLIKMRDFSRHG